MPAPDRARSETTAAPRAEQVEALLHEIFKRCFSWTAGAEGALRRILNRELLVAERRARAAIANTKGERT